MSRTVDALNRVTFVDYPEDALDTRYTFDDPLVSFSKGRLTAIIRNGATVPYRYDRFGRVLQDGALTYGYDANGNRQEIGYPGGVTASYSFDFADREERLALTEPGQEVKTLATSAGYLASGPLTSLLLGNGLVESRTYDGRSAPLSIRVPGKLDWEYETDRVGNILAIQDALTPAQPRSYTYQDYTYFLTQGNGPWGNLAWTYDKIGNRLTQTADGVTETYSYLPNAAGGNNPKLIRVAPPLPAEPTSYVYDLAGNQTYRSTGEEKLRFSYDAAGKLSKMSFDVAGQAPATTQLRYDGRSFLDLSTFSSQVGAEPQSQTHATYSSEGMLYHKVSALKPAASEPRDQPTEERDSYILYFAGRPVALFYKSALIPGEAPRTENRRLLFLTADHLGTPVLATRGKWSQAQEADLFLRFPGQLEDGSWANESRHSGLYYNVHCWYEMSSGRYTSPDPLGGVAFDPRDLLLPSQDTERFSYFAYVQGNPVSFVDPLGLFKVKGCTPQQESAINGSTQEFCKRLDDPGFAKCCGKPNLPGDLKKLCGDPNITIQCKSERTGLCKAEKGDLTCGWAIPYGQTVRICPDAWESGCGPLGCTVLHELTHILGHPREKLPDLVEDCLKCG